MRIMIVVVVLTCVSCVSKTGQEQRFSESATLTPPRLELNLRDSENYSFAAVGDLHVGNGDTTRLRTILNSAREEGDAFILLLGDLADEGERIDFVAIKEAIREAGFENKVLYVIGNHDIVREGWTHWKELLGPTHYSVAAGNSKFIVTDSADGTLGKTQWDWLTEELKQSRPTHLFLLSHYLPIVPGERTFLRFPDEWEGARLMRLAVNYSVTAWLGGHFHSFAKGTVDGVTYVVAGGGGGKRLGPVTDFFFVQVRVQGTTVNYELRIVP
ncbi:MAG: metallophosphoesterase [Deltaproteobacteria bacterium]|nr:metallophosphoesterase [Deltaproteobacteria bacterium]